jgi:hypothetical protein
MAMRLNEFQAKVAWGQSFPTGLVETSVVKRMEKEIAVMMVTAAQMAHTLGTDLDTICAVHLAERDAVAGDDPRNAHRAPMPETSGAIVP